MSSDENFSVDDVDYFDMEEVKVTHLLGDSTHHVFKVTHLSSKRALAMKVVVVDKYTNGLKEVKILRQLENMGLKLSTDGIPDLIDSGRLKKEDLKILNAYTGDNPIKVKESERIFVYLMPVYDTLPDSFFEGEYMIEERFDVYLEILILFVVLHKFRVIHGSVGDDQILFKQVDYDRIYDLHGVEYVAKFKYTPVLIDWEDAHFGDDGQFNDLADLKGLFRIEDDICLLRKLLAPIKDFTPSDATYKEIIISYIMRIAIFIVESSPIKKRNDSSIQKFKNFSPIY